MQLGEILLQSQTQLGRVSAQRGSAYYGLGDSVHRAVEGAPASHIRIITAGHYGSRGSITVQHGNASHHTLGRSQLGLATKGHQHSATTDGAIKALGKALLTAHVQATHIGQPSSLQISGSSNLCRHTLEDILGFFFGNSYIGMLSDAVGVQESTGQVYNLIPTPEHYQTGLSGNLSHNRSFKVFFISIFNESVTVCSFNNHSHTLLGFRNSQLGTIQALIFLRNLIQIDHEAIGELANSNGNATSAKIVAAFNHSGDSWIAEQALNLALGGRIALLYLGTAAHQGIHSVLLRRAGSAAAAITAGLTAQEDNDITCGRTLTAHRAAGRRTHNATDFHAFSNEFIMIIFLYMTGCQANLVTIGAIAGSGTNSNLALGQLARQGLAYRSARIGAAGDAHSLINIGTTGQGVANSAAKAGSGAAEGLDFRRMVMGFILKHNQPILGLAIHFDGYHDGASVDFLGLVQISQLTLLAQLLHADNSDIH